MYFQACSSVMQNQCHKASETPPYILMREWQSEKYISYYSEDILILGICRFFISYLESYVSILRRYIGKNILDEPWRDGSVVQGTCCPCRCLGFSSQYSWRVASKHLYLQFLAYLWPPPCFYGLLHTHGTRELKEVFVLINE